MPDVALFNEDDVNILKMLVNQERRRLRGRVGRRDPIDDESQQAPECYIALTPMAGIPALTADLNFGTSTGSGTGTDYGVAGNTPGYADCAIYHIVDTNDIPDLMPLNGLTLRVYNVSLTIVPGGTFVPIWRDKTGRWLALPHCCTPSPVVQIQEPTLDSECASTLLPALICVHVSNDATGAFAPYAGQRIQLTYNGLVGNKWGTFYAEEWEGTVFSCINSGINENRFTLVCDGASFHFALAAYNDDVLDNGPFIETSVSITSEDPLEITIEVDGTSSGGFAFDADCNPTTLDGSAATLTMTADIPCP